MDLSLVIKKLGHSLNRNSPTILTGLGVTGLLGTVVLAVRGTVKAMDILTVQAEHRLDEYEGQTGEIAYPTDVFTPQEIVELTWKEYIPTAAMGAVTIACMIGSNHISMRRNAALASLFSIAETTLREYQAKVVETIGEKKEEKIQGEIAQDKLDRNPVDEKTVIITGQGDYLCYESISKQYFRSHIDKILHAQNLFNQQLNREGWLSINHFFDLLGLEEMELSEELGWIGERGLMEVKKLSKIAKSGEPCLVIEYYTRPTHI